MAWPKLSDFDRDANGRPTEPRDMRVKADNLPPTGTRRPYPDPRNLRAEEDDQ